MPALAVAALTQSAFVGGVAGLQLVVSPGGTRAWRLFYRVAGGDGERRAMSLGRYPSVSLAEARRRASDALATAATGRDPKTARSDIAQRAEVTVAATVDAYLAACAAANDPKTVADKACAFRNHLVPAIGRLSISEVNRPTLLKIIDSLTDQPATRRTLFAYLRHLLAWAAERDLIAANPFLGVRAPKAPPARERFLTDDEIRMLWRARGTMADIARLCLLTAQRKGSVEAMRWDEVDLENGEWLIPAAVMKSGRNHRAPLGPTAIALIKGRPQLSGPYVFGVGSNGAKAYAGASKGFAGLRRQLGDCDWRLHDLRRTAVTLAQRAGCSIDAIKALTQHKTSGVIGVYARHDFAAEKRMVAGAIEAEILALTASKGA